jgi:hypothetical protein
MALAAVVLLVFSLVLIAIGLRSVARLRRARRVWHPMPASSPTASPESQPAYRSRATGMPDQVLQKPAASAAPGYGGGLGYGREVYDGAPGYEGAGSATAYPGGMDADADAIVGAYPGGMDAEAAEIERLKAEIAALKAHGVEGTGFKRTQALVAVAANVSGILGLLVSVAALVK